MAATKKPIEVLAFVQVTPPLMRERNPVNDALGAFEIPVSSQIVSQIIEAVATGRLAPETPLPSHADLADHWRVNRNTVTDAFKRLRAAYAIEGDNLRTFVTRDPRRVRALVARERLSSAIRFALSLDMRPDDVEKQFTDLLDAHRKDRRDAPRRAKRATVASDKRGQTGRRDADTE